MREREREGGKMERQKRKNVWLQKSTLSLPYEIVHLMHQA
jgi:hypothetical protein